MTISEQNIIKRWSLMASKDLGIDINVQSREYLDLFNQIFVNDNLEIDSRGMRCIKPTIRGFAINNEGMFRRCCVTECLDLDFIGLDKSAAAELDWFLMNEMGWANRYEYATSI